MGLFDMADGTLLPVPKSSLPQRTFDDLVGINEKHFGTSDEGSDDARGRLPLNVKHVIPLPAVEEILSRVGHKH